MRSRCLSEPTKAIFLLVSCSDGTLNEAFELTMTDRYCQDLKEEVL